MSNPFATHVKPHAVNEPSGSSPEPGFTSTGDPKRLKNLIQTTANPNRPKNIEVMTPELGENVVVHVEVPPSKHLIECNSPAPFPLDMKMNEGKTPQTVLKLKQQASHSPDGVEDTLRVHKSHQVHCHTDLVIKNGGGQGKKS